MNEDSILKRSLFFTGKLVGIVALWITVLSFVLVTITGKVLVSISGRSSDSVEKTNTIETDARGAKRHEPASNPAKPNG